MSTAAKSTFVYVTYIKTTVDKAWEAVTDPRFMREYWGYVTIESEWKKGSPWKMVRANGTITDAGEVLEIEKPRRIVMRWEHQMNPELKAEGPTRCTIELEPKGDAVKMTITHESERPNSKVISAVSGGWPMIVSNLKSLLETGHVAVSLT